MLLMNTQTTTTTTILSTMYYTNCKPTMMDQECVIEPQGMSTIDGNLDYFHIIGLLNLFWALECGYLICSPIILINAR